MGSLIDRLMSKQLIHPPPFLKDNVHYEVLMGSVAYGVSTDTSDMDIYGFCIPPKHIIFPHLTGVIKGFGNQGPNFEQWQQHSIIDDNKTNILEFIKERNIDPNISLQDIEREIKRRNL
jgi:hypothetical protein